MRMQRARQIQAIVDEAIPRLVAGEISLDAVLAAHPEQAEVLRPHLENARWISAQQDKLAPRPGYVNSSRHYLVSLINATRPTGFWRRMWRPHSAQRLALQVLSLSLLVVSLAFVLNTLRLASRLALPGDWLYPAKLSIESVQLALTFDPTDKARMQIELTQRRTTEIVQLVLEDELDQLPNTSRRLEAQIEQAVGELARVEATNPAQAEVLSTAMAGMLENERFILTLLHVITPGYASGGLDQAIDVTTAGLNALGN
mgnify:FL=1